MADLNSASETALLTLTKEGKAPSCRMVFYGLRPFLLSLLTIPSLGQSIGTNGFEFSIPWSSGTPVIVEASTNLANPVWVSLSTNVQMGGTSYFNDPQWTNYSKRFYRSISLDRSSWSSNLVGFVRLAISPGYNLIANPLSTGVTNGANEIIPVIPDSQFLTWNGAGFDAVQYSSIFSAWVNPATLDPANPPSLPPGRGFFFYNPSSTASTLTFVGQVVPALCMSNNFVLPPGYSLIGSPLPADASEITFPPVSLPLIGDMIILEWYWTGYSAAWYSTLLGTWIRPGYEENWPPAYAVGKGLFFYNPGHVTNWLQSLACP